MGVVFLETGPPLRFASFPPLRSPDLPSPFSSQPFMFRVSQEIDFCYGHRLLNYAGKCRNLHGHNGRAVIVMEGAELDSRGMLIDFGDIKQAIRTWIDDQLDHRMILCESDPALPFLKSQGEPVYTIAENPTAENIARLIYDYSIGHGFPVVEVSLWETPRSCATYRAPDRRG